LEFCGHSVTIPTLIVRQDIHISHDCWLLSTYRIADAYSGKGDYEAALAHYDCAVGLVLEMVDYPIAGDLQGAVCLESLKASKSPL
jgi:hypothetical protein